MKLIQLVGIAVLLLARANLIAADGTDTIKAKAAAVQELRELSSKATSKEIENLRVRLEELGVGQQVLGRLGPLKSQAEERERLQRAILEAERALLNFEIKTSRSAPRLGPEGELEAFPELKAHTGAIQCGIYDAATASVKDLFADSGYTDSEIEVFEKFEKAFGKEFLGKCNSPDRSVTDEIARIKEGLPIEKEKLLQQVEKLFLRRAKAQEALLAEKVESLISKATYQERKEVKVDKWPHLALYLDLLKKGEAEACIPCEAQHRNDMLLFLGQKKAYAVALKYVEQLSKSFADAPEIRHKNGVLEKMKQHRK